MEIARWKGLVSGSSLGASSWVAFAVAAGFCAVICVVALCAKAAGSRGVSSNDGDGYCSSSTSTSNGDGESEITAQEGEGPPQQWRRWIAAKKWVANIVKRGGRRRLVKREDLFAVTHGESLVAGANRTRDVAESDERNRNVEARNDIVGGPPVWQRRILMGERCQLPTFSGLILYDERGNPLPHHPSRLYHIGSPDGICR